MEFRNIHFAPSSAEETPAPAVAPEPAAELTLRIRRVKVSPADEYRMRTGNPRPISMALAAMILSKSGKAEITSKGVRVDRTDIGKRSYWHSDSRLCNDLSHRNRKVFYVINALQPEIIHLLDETGRYLESLPQVEGVTPFDTEATVKAHAAKDRQIARITKHMQRIHQPDAEETLEAKSRLTSEMQRVVSLLDPPVESNATEAPSPLGDRIAEAVREGSRQTYREIPSHEPKASDRHSSPQPQRQTAMELLLANSDADDGFDL